MLHEHSICKLLGKEAVLHPEDSCKLLDMSMNNVVQVVRQVSSVVGR